MDRRDYGSRLDSQRSAESPPPAPRMFISADEEIESIGIGRFHKTALVVCGMANAADAVELLAVGYIIPELDVSSSEKGFVSAAVFAGMLFGGLIAGTLADKWGRKPLLLVSLGINAVFGLISAVLPNWYWLAVARVVSGLGVGGSIPTVFTLFAEYLPVDRRGRYLTGVAAFWMVGSIYTAGVAWIMLGWLNLSWRLFAVAAAFPACATFVLVAVLLPESPRYLYEQGNVEACEAVLIRIAGACSRPSSFASSRQLQRVTPPPPSPPGCRLSERTRDAWASVVPLFHGRLGRTTFLLIVTWFTLSFGWYGLILWVPTLFKDAKVELDEFQNAFVVAAANLPGNIVALYLVERVRRKSLLSASMALSGVLAFAFAFSKNAVIIVAVASMMNAVSVCGWNALDCLSTEVFPTTLRTSGMGLLAAWGRLGSITGQIVFSWLIDVSVTVLLLVASSMLFVGALAGALLPSDTAGAQLPSRVPTKHDRLAASDGLTVDSESVAA